MPLRAAILLLLFAVCAHGQAPQAEAWMLRNGQQLTASLVAADGLRATFAPAGKPKLVLSFTELAEADAKKIQAWRVRNYFSPLIDPACLAPWPAQAAAEAFDIQGPEQDGGIFAYESPHFRLFADVKLSNAVVKDLALVLEATRAALIAMPLGLHAGGERDKYPVLLISTHQAYADAGGPTGSGGFYEARTGRMLILLPNLGIEQKRVGMKLDYGKSLFVVKHEVTHQLLARWHRNLPNWLAEGLAEVVASLPYSQGRYTLQNPAAGMRDYVLKWRKSRDDRTVRLWPATQLMAMTDADWRGAVEQEVAYDRYNSAALLTLHFLQHENGAGLAAYLDASRRERKNAEPDLLRGRTREEVATAVAALAKKLGLEVK